MSARNAAREGNQFAEVRHWFFQTLRPEQRLGFFISWCGFSADAASSLTIEMQHSALRSALSKAHNIEVSA